MNLLDTYELRMKIERLLEREGLDITGAGTMLDGSGADISALTADGNQVTVNIKVVEV